MYRQEVFVICIQIFLQHPPITFQQPAPFGFYNYDGRPFQTRETNRVTIRVTDGYHNCGLQAADNYVFNPMYLTNNQNPVYFIKKRDSGGQARPPRPPVARPPGPGRQPSAKLGSYRYQFTASRKPLVPTNEDNVITNHVADPPLGPNPNAPGAFSPIFGVMRSVFCEDSKMEKISVLNWNDPQLNLRNWLENWYECGVLEKLIKLCMIDTDVNGRRGERIRDMDRRLAQVFRNPAQDVMGVGAYVRANCMKFFEVDMIRTRLDNARKYLVGRKILQGALDAGFRLLVVQGALDGVNCNEPLTAWSIHSTQHWLRRPDQGDDGYREFYEQTVTNSRAQRWYFCSYRQAGE